MPDAEFSDMGPLGDALIRLARGTRDDLSALIRDVEVFDKTVCKPIPADLCEFRFPCPTIS
jgi:hypothetical protein